MQVVTSRQLMRKSMSSENNGQFLKTSHFADSEQYKSRVAVAVCHWTTEEGENS